jgi:hypothetical protein
VASITCNAMKIIKIFLIFKSLVRVGVNTKNGA